jgi:hypothetical protein
VSPPSMSTSLAQQASAAMLQALAAPLLTWTVLRARIVDVIRSLSDSEASFAAAPPRKQMQPAPLSAGTGIGIISKKRAVQAVAVTKRQHQRHCALLAHAQWLCACLPRVEQAATAAATAATAATAALQQQQPLTWPTNALCGAYLELFGASLSHARLLACVLQASLAQEGCEVYSHCVLLQNWEDGEELLPTVPTPPLLSTKQQQRNKHSLSNTPSVDSLSSITSSPSPTPAISAPEPEQEREPVRLLVVAAHRVVIVGRGPSACAAVTLKMDEKILQMRPVKRRPFGASTSDGDGSGGRGGGDDAANEDPLATRVTVSRPRCTHSRIGCYQHRDQAVMMKGVMEAIMEVGLAVFQGGGGGEEQQPGHEFGGGGGGAAHVGQIVPPLRGDIVLQPESTTTTKGTEDDTDAVTSWKVSG